MIEPGIARLQDWALFSISTIGQVPSEPRKPYRTVSTVGAMPEPENRAAAHTEQRQERRIRSGPSFSSAVRIDLGR